MKNKKFIYNLTLCAVMIALATALSLVQIWKMPLGGTVTLLSMVPVIMISYMLGLKWGISAAFVYSVIQLFLGIEMDGVLGWGLTPLSLIGTIMLDYILAFTVLGFAGIFRKMGNFGILFGTALVLICRFLCHFISGAIIFDIWCEWKNVWLYSLCYNGTYMLPELILTCVGVFFLLKAPAFRKLLGENH